jgi:ABC-type bacteriocin/lantibiotic exporter with double-glycine peptidase domain
LLFAAWQQVRFVSRLQADIARRLFTTYLTQPWPFHLQRNSSELVRNISEIPTLALTCIGLLSTLAESMIMVGILGLLLWFEPTGAIVVGSLMAAATWVLERVSRNRLVQWGQSFHHHAKLGYKSMLEGLGGAKDVKMRGCEKLFIDQFSVHRNAQVLMQGRQMLFNQVPRLWYELLAVAALCALTAVMDWQGKSNRAMIPTLGLFAAAAFRMLPSVNRLASAAQNLRFSTAVIDTVASELKLGGENISEDLPRPLAFENTISIDRVTFRYPGAAVDSLSDVSLRIAKGESVGIVGGSGAGKSTLVDVILGLLTPHRGRVLVDGRDISADVRSWQATIGYVPQTIYLCDDTLRRNIAFGIPDDRIDEAAFTRAVHAAQLHAFIATLPQGAETLVGEQGVRLSGGQRQRIGIARALYHDPTVLVLDEATSALDNATESSVMEAVDALHGVKTLIIVAHRLTTVGNCDVIYKLDHGKVVKTGTFAEVFSK